MYLFALILVFLSGVAGLVYQVLWMRQLGLLFGNTSHAAAVTLAAFFAGLAIGSWIWGRRCTAIHRPLRAYAGLELGIVITACLYFLGLQLYYVIYPPLYQHIGSGTLNLAVKFLLACVLVLPPAIFMGGTIPIMGQYLIGLRRDQTQVFGKTAALIYGINTLGAAIGALAAGFYLPIWLGFRMTFILAMTVTGLTALGAYWLSRTCELRARPSLDDAASPASDQAATVAATATHASEDRPTGLRWVREQLPLAMVCFLSGFGFLALEVLWTRMFMQVLENSVYTYASILVIVLVSLALGAMISSLLARMAGSPINMLAALLLLGGAAVASTPFVFMHVTDSLQILATRGSWSSYVGMIFQKATIALGPAALTLGAVFPFLMKIQERYMRVAGLSIGRLGAINTGGAILGALLCGFVFLPVLGTWRTMQLLAAAYVIGALILPMAWDVKGICLRVACAGLLLCVFVAIDPDKLDVTSTDPQRTMPEVALKTWEASDNTISVVSGPYGLMIKMNSHYGLGTTGSAPQEQMQTDLPMTVFPNITNIFYLGMGTGITAGAALDPTYENVERVVVCELSSQVIDAASEFFTDVRGRDFTNGLFSDTRADVLAEDGRHYLLASREQFDMINGDLFVPFRAGVGSLYTREHFQNVKQRLTPDGVFVQWLPLYQVTEFEFGVIARTMLDVFDQVTLWRSTFQPTDDVVALVGHMSKAPLPATDLDSRDDMQNAVAGKGVFDLQRLLLPFNSQTALLFYCGNVTETASIFDAYPINTDDWPVIEFLAPRNFRRAAPGTQPWFVSARVARLVERMQTQCPPSKDPMLAHRSDADRRLPIAGSHYYGARVWMMAGDLRRAEIAWQRFLDAWLNRPQ